ncbi:hypothetical protein ACJMK2_023784 [Sinanodonta woodiana]|uniref:EB domain-containing protein n=1 Tax=Sinanodonta woodiana TaxID=1069815 RepID=A0ABD3T661_SINWO
MSAIKCSITNVESLSVSSYVKAEPCTQVSDCNYETCTGTDWHIACEHGLCTCSFSAGGSNRFLNCTETDGFRLLAHPTLIVVIHSSAQLVYDGDAPTITTYVTVAGGKPYVKAEPCTQTSDCHFETCTGSDWHLGCVQGVCTCTPTSGSTACQSDADCGRNHFCPFGLRWRCSSFDHYCHCRRG